MPLSANRAHRAIATTTQIDVIRYLRRFPGSTAHQISQSLDLDTETLRSVLRGLERLGYLTINPDLPRGRRQGRLITYEVQDHLLLAHLEVLFAYLRGAHSGAVKD
ncbi:MarR family transcriptional regulator [Microbacterium sp. USHLN272]|uniref:MarR family transcriptional regulator n=1 Tax=Microbacterium sp. USHLN272 TaxID=3081287 RepID=UPI003FA59A7A